MNFETLISFLFSPKLYMSNIYDIKLAAIMRKQPNGNQSSKGNRVSRWKSVMLKKYFTNIYKLPVCIYRLP